MRLNRRTILSGAIAAAPGVTPCHGAERLSDQADHDHRSGGGGRADRHGRPPHRRKRWAERSARPSWSRMSAAPVERSAWRAPQGRHPTATRSRSGISRTRPRPRFTTIHQIRRRQRLRSPRPHHRRADDPGVQAGIGGQATSTELLAGSAAMATRPIYGHAGIGSASHLCMLMLMKELGVQMNGIPYRGTGPAMNDLLSNQFDLMCDQTTNTTNQIKEGKIKGFAVTTKTRSRRCRICRRSMRAPSKASRSRRGTRCGRRRDCRRMSPTSSSQRFRRALKDAQGHRALREPRHRAGLRPIWRRRQRSRRI